MELCSWSPHVCPAYSDQNSPGQCGDTPPCQDPPGPGSQSSVVHLFSRGADVHTSYPGWQQAQRLIKLSQLQPKILLANTFFRFLLLMLRLCPLPAGDPRWHCSRCPPPPPPLGSRWPAPPPHCCPCPSSSSSPPSQCGLENLSKLLIPPWWVSFIVLWPHSKTKMISYEHNHQLGVSVFNPHEFDKGIWVKQIITVDKIDLWQNQLT